MTESFDEIDAHFDKKAGATEGEAIKMEHIMLKKVSMNPARRKLLRGYWSLREERETIKGRIVIKRFLL